MKTRLDLLMRSQGLNAVRLAEMIGVQRSGISHIMSGRNKPSFDFIVSILQQFPFISPEWLILGQGNMYKDVTNTNSDGETKEIQSTNDASVVNNTDLDIFSIIDNNSVAQQKLKYDNKRSLVQDTSNTPTPINKDNFPKSIFSGDDIESVVILKRDGTFISYKPAK